MTDGRSPILRKGLTCGRIAEAGRAAVLIDGAAYFAALRQTILAAERSIFIAGWDVDSRTRLVGESGAAEDDAPETLGALLTQVARNKPGLTVHVLLWDYSLLYALEREALPRLNLDWKTPPQIQVCLDDVLPLGASHHQKIVVVDDSIAFCGGLDLTIRRWDTPAHDLDNAARVDPADKAYDPFHDVQMIVDGDAACALAEVVRERWYDAACRRPLDIAPGTDLWPDDLRPDFERVEIGVARTLPAMDRRPELREVEALYLRSIEAAERHIYIENQYLTANRVAEALVRRLSETPGLEVVIVGPQEPAGWLEAQSMGAGRHRFVRHLQQADVLDRVRLFYPVVRQDAREQAIMVHAKVMVVDDAFLRVGSSNLNNRSMGLDSECDLAIEARAETQRRAIARLRDRLLSEHLGATPEEIGAQLADHGSLFQLIDASAGAKRRLLPLEPEGTYDEDVAQVIGAVADPERPVRSEQFVGDMFQSSAGRSGRRRLVRLGAAAVALLGLVLLWQVSPLAAYVEPARIEPWLDGLTANVWTPAAVVLLFLVGGLVMFPVTVMIALTAMTLGPWSGFLTAVSGSLLSAALSYGIGAFAGRRALRNLMGRRLRRISLTLGRRGVLSVVTLRLLPVAPFTLINLVSGASHIRFGDFLLGTLIGMAPGIAAMTALGDRLSELWRSPSAENLVLFGLVVALWLALSVVLQGLVSWLRRRRGR